MGKFGTNLGPNPEVSANILSRLTFVYVIPFMLRGYKKQLEEEDLYEPIPNHKSELAAKRLARSWENELARAKKVGRKPSLFKAVMSSYLRRAFVLGILLFFEEAVHFTQPIMIGRLIQFFSVHSTLTINDAYFAATCIAISGALCPLLHHPYFYGVQKLGCELKIATSGIIMQKSLRLSSGALHETTIGHIVTMMSNDVTRFDFLFQFINYLWIGPFMLVAYIYMLWYETGPSCVAGLVTLILFLPIQSFFSRQMGHCRKLIATQTDQRISVMDEILNGIRVVKMYSWEDAFASVIADLRKKELNYVKKNTIWQSLVIGTFWGSTKFIVMFVILLYIFLGNKITAEKAFVTTALFNACRQPLTLFVPFAFQHIFESKVSFKRIQDFLELEDYNYSMQSQKNGIIALTEKNPGIGMKLCDTSRNEKSSVAGIEKNEIVVEVDSLSTTWEEKDKEKKSGVAVRNVSFKAGPGDLVIVIGPVGCGKSSLLFSLLHETKYVTGKMKVQGKIAYASQEPWLFSGTVRENILFGKPFDVKKYREAIRVCCLTKDLTQLPHGDLSLVGDRGQSLSGGQRARIGLARAVYSDADIYLLDDPLSAVDAAVGRYLFKKYYRNKRCIAGVLKTKLTILVTHQVQFLNSAKLVVVMENGEMVTSGTMKQLSQTRRFSDILLETEKTYKRRISASEESSPLKAVDVPEFFDDIAEEDDIGDEDEIFYLAPEEQSPSVDQAKLVELAVSLRKLNRKASRPQSSRFNSQSPSRRSEMSESSLSVVLECNDNTVFEAAAEEEDRVAGAVSWRIYFLYFKAMAHPAYLLFFALSCSLAVQIFNNFIDWWLNKWATASEKAMCLGNGTVAETFSAKNLSDAKLTSKNFVDVVDFKFFTMELSLSAYRNTFVVMVAVFMVVSVLRCVWFRLAQVAGCALLHNRMFETIVKTPVSFFDRNPVGRILNRFSKDVGMMDDRLSFIFFELFAGVLQLSGTTLVILVLNPIVFAPFFPLCIAFWYLRRFYLASSRAIQRLEATSRSPLYSHVSAVMHGLPTVRSYGAESLAMEKFCYFQDRNSAAYFLGLLTSRWFGSANDWLVAFFIAIVTFSSIFTTAAINSGEIALILIYAIQLTGFFSYLMRQSADVQTGMVSIERIINYTELPYENIDEGSVPPETWPYAGGIIFKNVCLKYEEDGGYILNSINVEILPKEKVGIVGRTGAGKSSLLRVLFRLTEPEGSVVIDGLVTKDLTLRELRRRLSIIPQDPVIFIGSLRRNLDPFDEYSDENLWSALEQAIFFCLRVKLKTLVTNLPDRLETHMKERGANFSVGQRQLICLARAILRNSKILVLDEATANVDPETDSLIQQTIKANFVDCTVLTVAHRLHTIMDSDKVMVLDGGVLAEYGHPHLLLKNEQGIFSALVAETGEETAWSLKILAKASYDSNY